MGDEGCDLAPARLDPLLPPGELPFAAVEVLAAELLVHLVHGVALIEGRLALVELANPLAERLLGLGGPDVRPPTAKELKATAILRMPLDEASAKVRTGPPVDEEADYALPVWAGVIPLELVAREPRADPRLATDVDPPTWRRR